MPSSMNAPGTFTLSYCFGNGFSSVWAKAIAMPLLLNAPLATWPAGRELERPPERHLTELGPALDLVATLKSVLSLASPGEGP